MSKQKYNVEVGHEPNIVEEINKIILTTDRPFYIFDLDKIREAVDQFQRVFKENNIDLEIVYSTKTNPHKNILSFLGNLGIFGEASCLEEMACLKEANSITKLFNGIYKTKDDMVEAIAQKSIIILDGLEQLELLSSVMGISRQHIQVGIRVSSSPIIQDAGTRFGLPQDDYRINELLKKIEDLPNIQLVLFHIHLGTNISDTDKYLMAMEKLVEIYESINVSQRQIRYFDIGGGMPAGAEESWINELSLKLSRLLIEREIKQKIVIEPGRSLVEKAGYLVVEVVGIRQRLCGPGLDIIVNAGTNCVMGHKYGSKYKCFALNCREGIVDGGIRILGPLCNEGDIIENNYKGSPLEIGDRLVISGIGAYDYSTSYQFGRVMPETYFVGANYHA